MYILDIFKSIKMVTFDGNVFTVLLLFFNSKTDVNGRNQWTTTTFVKKHKKFLIMLL